MATYPDLTPRSDPTGLQKLEYDPFGLMPEKLPPHPRVLVTMEQIRRTRARVRRGGWARRCLDRLLANCGTEGLFDRPLPVPADKQKNNKALGIIERNAMAFHVTGRREYRQTAMLGMRRLADIIGRLSLKRDGDLLVGGSLGESRAVGVLGHIYDLLAAADPASRDDRAFRSLLEATRQASDACSHLTCGNHNTWSLTGRISVALALGNLQWLHDGLYGCQCPAGWRYGLIHQLRHDILSDGMHWERSFGYHYYTLMGLADAADTLWNSGIDVWHKELPTLKQDDSKDVHRAYGPVGDKCLKAAYDALFYMMFANGDLSLVSDSGLANIRGTYIWGVIYDKAYEAYKDPKYAWLLNRAEREYGNNRQFAGVPMPLQSHRGDLDFVRLKYERYPAGSFSLKRDTRISLCGEHRHCSTLFPVYGAVTLRGGTGAAMPGAFMWYGPHTAGHQAPAALHLDVQLGARVVTSAPRLSGYGDPLYLTWGRTTIAHNTVTADMKPMFPYDFDTESIWECDRWRDNVSDGELVWFRPGNDFSAVRARNGNVYPGVMLDRTLVVTRSYVLDVFRVSSGKPHQLDWAMHLVGPVSVPGSSRPCDLGKNRGYCHMRNARLLPWKKSGILEWGPAGCCSQVAVAMPAGGLVVLADDPPVHKGKSLGEFEEPLDQSTLMVRVRATSALFVSAWSTVNDHVCIRRVSGRADGLVTVNVTAAGKRDRWRLPFDGEPKTCR